MSHPSPKKEEKAVEAYRTVQPSWDAMHAAVALTELERRQRRRRRVPIVVAAVTALAAGLAFALWRPTNEALPARALHFADGSTVVPDATARLAVQEESATRVRVQVEGGAAEISVTPRPTRTFLVDVAELRVVVMGTHFVVEPLVVGARVQVREGHVRVERARGGAFEHVRDLYTGEAETFGSVEPPSAPEAAAVPLPKATVLRAVPREDWRVLSKRGAYPEAFAALQAAAPVTSVEDLLLAADAARLSGHSLDALTYLERVRTTHPTDPRAAAAAFTAGRLHLGQKQFSEAARAFEATLELGAEGTLHENALARAVEAHAKAGDLAAAERNAKLYLERYPNGAWANSVRNYGKAKE